MKVDQLAEVTKEQLNKDIEARAFLSEIKIATAKNGKKYANFVLQDSTKSLEARVWDYEDNETMFNNIKKGNIIDIKATVTEYQDKLQLTIKEVFLVEEEIDLSKYIPTSSWNYDKMQGNLMEFYDKVQSPHIKKLLDELIFSEDYYKVFCEYPAAKTVHHNFYHGLLQHVLEILYYCNTVAKMKRLSQIQIDRMIAIAMLHDWAKIIEYKKLPELGITTTGSMLGHIFLGAHHAMSVIEKIENFPENDMLIIINGILGHHGTYEWGSPVLPKTVEAQIVHEADKMSGDVESIMSHIEQNKDREEEFSGKLWNMGTDYYLK
jgi:3'-5' exoribonuclease